MAHTKRYLAGLKMYKYQVHKNNSVILCDTKEEAEKISKYYHKVDLYRALYAIDSDPQDTGVDNV